MPAGATAETIDLAALFGRTAPIEVDLGCGDGALLQSLAREQPNHNFLGIERLLHRVRKSDRKAANLPNVRVLRSETLFALRHLLPPQSIRTFYLLFPDPWPKRRHHRRRLITGEFLAAIKRCLTADGLLYIATDHDDYFAAMRKVVDETHELTITNQKWNLPPSSFERRFSDAGRPIHRLTLRKVSPVTYDRASQPESRKNISTAPVSL